MGLFKKKKDLPLIARVDLTKIKKEREENFELGDKPLLANPSLLKRIPKIRLFYVAIEKFDRYGVNGGKAFGKTFGVSSPFLLPSNMKLDDAYKVVSYLSEKVEKEEGLEPASEKSVARVSNLLEYYGFDKLYGYSHGHFHGVQDALIPFRKITVENLGFDAYCYNVIDLFTVGGNFKLFNKTSLSDRYFEWFTKGITEEEVKEIYKNIGREDLYYFGKERENAIKEEFAKSTGGKILEEKLPEGWSAVKVGDSVSALCESRGKIIIEDKEKQY